MLSTLQITSAPAALTRYEYQGQYYWQKQERGDWLSRVQIEQRESQARRVHGQGGVRQLEAGRWFELTQHPLYERKAAEARQFLLIEVQFFAESNLPMAQQRREAPGSLAPLFKNVRPAPGGWSAWFSIERSVLRLLHQPFRRPAAQRAVPQPVRARQADVAWPADRRGGLAQRP